ncbi:MAG: Na+/H+ antiporter NhaC [Fastidiosipila sp.]|nr:Na+/H+ antiporter NhaC [Fastidiosipila sp.]
MKKTKASKPKEMTIKRALFGFFIPILILAALLIVGASVAIAALVAVFALLMFGLYMGYSWESLENSMGEGVKSITIAALVMLLVGSMVASWMSSGSIPTMLYYGLKIISPTVFLPTSFILTAIMSFVTGTSWGSISTIGVVLSGMAVGLGIPIPLAAGAIISGSLFGDKMSPLSDTTLLAAATAEVSVFEHIKSMWYTTLPGFVISLVLFTILGLNASGSIDKAAITEMLSGLSSNFNISLFTLIPVVLVLVLSAKQVPALIAFGSGIVSAFLISLIMQGRNFAENITYLMSGFSLDTGVDSINTLVNRGGFESMLSLVAIILVFGMMSGLFTETKVLTVLVSSMTNRLKNPANLLSGVMLSSLLLAFVGGQYPAIAIPGVAFKEATDDADIHRAVLSRTLEDVGTMTAPLIPWNPWTIGYGVLLSTTPQAFIPYVFLCILSPIVALINNYLGIGLYRRNDEFKYRPFWRRKKVATATSDQSD